MRRTRGRSKLSANSQDKPTTSTRPPTCHPLSRSGAFSLSASAGTVELENSASTDDRPEDLRRGCSELRNAGSSAIRPGDPDRRFNQVKSSVQWGTVASTVQPLENVLRGGAGKAAGKKTTTQSSGNGSNPVKMRNVEVEADVQPGGENSETMAAAAKQRNVRTAPRDKDQQPAEPQIDISDDDEKPRDQHGPTEHASTWKARHESSPPERCFVSGPGDRRRQGALLACGR